MEVRVQPDTRPEQHMTVANMPALQWHYVATQDAEWLLAVKVPGYDGTYNLWFPERHAWGLVTKNCTDKYSKMAAKPVPPGTEILFKV